MKNLGTFLIFPLFLFVAALSCGAESRVVIGAIENRSSTPIKVVDTALLQKAALMEVSAHGVKSLQKPLIIPFVSALSDTHRMQFLTDDSYVPDAAIKISTSRGTFAVWMDETGVVCSRIFERGAMSKADATTKKLWQSHEKRVRNKNFLRVISLLLSVNRAGSIELHEQQ